MNTLVKAEIWTVARTEQGNAVLVRPVGSDVAVPIFVGQLETQAILIGFGDVAMPRPLTHDLMLAVLRRLGAELLRIEINDLRDGTFFARLVLEANGAEFVMDARPSDAIALAVRKKCAVYVAESVVDAAGVAVNLIMEAASAADAADAAADVAAGAETSGEDADPFSAPADAGSAGSGSASSREAERGRLIAELEKAIAMEEYEKAAAIRDRLADLDGEAPR